MERKERTLVQAVDECQRPEYAIGVTSTRNFVTIKPRASDLDTVHPVTASLELPPSAPTAAPGMQAPTLYKTKMNYYTVR